jgi:hypothetical protein
MHGARAGWPESCEACPVKGEVVGLFRRKSKGEGVPKRCPLCTENLPDGADECVMCGADLRALGLRPVAMARP